MELVYTLPSVIIEESKVEVSEGQKLRVKLSHLGGKVIKGND